MTTRTGPTPARRNRDCIERLTQVLIDTADKLLRIMDREDGDADLEPSIGHGHFCNRCPLVESEGEHDGLEPEDSQ